MRDVLILSCSGFCPAPYLTSLVASISCRARYHKTCKHLRTQSNQNKTKQPKSNNKEEEMAPAEDVKVLGLWASPYVQRVRIALNLKGIAHEYVEESLFNKSELFLKSNPVYKKVPVLIHNGNPICESPIIVQYIDEARPSTAPAILPADAYHRATTRFWATYYDDKVAPAIRGVGMGPTEAAKAEAAKQLSAGLLLLEEAFEKLSKGNGFFGGVTIGYLDIIFGSVLGWLAAVGKMSDTEFLDEEKTPLLAAWAERFRSHAAVKEVMPDTERLVEYAKMLQARFSASPPAK